MSSPAGVGDDKTDNITWTSVPTPTEGALTIMIGRYKIYMQARHGSPMDRREAAISDLTAWADVPSRYCQSSDGAPPLSGVPAKGLGPVEVPGLELSPLPWESGGQTKISSEVSTVWPH